ncbi:hypothetical protein DSO57_1037555 [Entomophthora muscae]|uniref:Uncharacterized protein n=1 Tax=Entomophthora muscae TaxID=34485 RepID=A0ACC2SZ87_9FUNG|nr:hypothetical protein DSO57_1037555 [Entomophthora muscae]
MSQLASMVLNLWTPLASSRPTPNLTTDVIPAAMLLYLAVSLRQCNILAKAFCQAVNFYSIVYTLNSFELPNLSSYVTKLLPSILGYYTLQGNSCSVTISPPKQGERKDWALSAPIVRNLPENIPANNLISAEEGGNSPRFGVGKTSKN